MAKITKEPGVDLNIQIPMLDGSTKLLGDLVNEVIQSKMVSKAGGGKREIACELFVQEMYKRGSVFRKPADLRDIVAAMKNSDVIKTLDIHFSWGLLLKRGYVTKVTKTITNEKTGKKVEVSVFAPSPEAIKKFLTPEKLKILGTVKAPVEKKEESIEAEILEK